MDTHKKGLCALAVLAAVLACTSALAVMSVDLGGEFMKIAIVKPGVPMETVLNKESSRKTPTMVAFRDGDRHFLSQAQTTAIKFPPKAFFHLGHVIGRSFDDPMVDLFRKRFPYYNLLKDEERGTVLFKIDDETTYSPEELYGMVLEKAREYAQDFAEQDIKDCVITVPAFYNQAERRAVKTAAQLIGLNVLQLMSDNAAVALNYGVFRRKNFNSTMQYYMFYDMGATSTTATVVGYNVAKTKEGERMETNPQVTIKGVGFDRTLGGLEFTLRLREYLADTFDGQKKTKTPVRSNNRAMAKLLKEAERVKKVLSANNDHAAQVEGLLDEKDFKTPVKRTEYEVLCKDLYERVTKPVEEALRVSEITLPEISEIILFGGGTRIPMIQDLLMKFVGRSELGKSINTDEAAVLGAVYQAAYLGKGFKVKKFGVREGNVYPINVEFEKQRSAEDTEDKPKVIKRTLFGRMNPFPQKKVMTFNKHSTDFDFNVLYSGLDFLSEDDKKSFASPVISRYSLKGVQEALDKNKDVAEAKGIKAHFKMDESGILTLDKVESVFEKNSTGEDGEKSTWSKLGSAISGMFGGGGDDDNKVEDSPDTPEQSTEEASLPEAQEGGDKKEDKADSKGDKTEEDADKKEEKKEKPKEEKESKKDKDSKKEEEPKKEGDDKSDKKEKESNDKPKDSDKKESSEKKGNETDKAEDKRPVVPKVLNIKEDIKTEGEVKDLKDISEDQFKVSKKRLKELKDLDKAKVELEKSKNELESFIFDVQDKLSIEGPHQDCSTEEEREKLNTQLSEASDWLYEQPEDTKKYEFNQKTKALQAEFEPIKRRVWEHQERPKALEGLRYTINQTEVFYAYMKNMSDIEDPIYTKVEMTTMEKIITETVKWRDDNMLEQNKLKDHENPAVFVEDIYKKMTDLDREMRYLINKAKNWKPKKPKEDKKTTNETKEGKADKSKAKKADKPESKTEEKPDDTKETPTEEKPVETTEETTEETKSKEQSPDSVEKEEATPTAGETKDTEGKKKRRKSKKKSEEPTQEEILELDAAPEATDKDAKTEL